MIKLIASDMDGTLLNAEMQISEENVAAIRYAQSQGIEFMVATGRNRAEALPPLTQAGIECAMITLNGAQVFDKAGNSLFSAPIEQTVVQKTLALLDEHEIYYEIATNEGIYTANKEQRIENFASAIAEMMPHLTYNMAIAMSVARLDFFPIHIVEDLHELVMRDDLSVLKIICFHKEGAKRLGPVAKEIDAFGDLAVTSSGQNNIEINHRNAQKGIAVSHVANDRQIPLSEVMTIGDNLNDVSMLQAAGVSFAMGNGLPEVKEYAKYVTETNIESGVGKAIRRAIDENLA
ncbi:Cof-type HAD-IIB family hydrolase [Candidatus Enterococcus willemsii]|uniref:HAD family hydrolase n=1 Tax=Candidatus Enterococcus willemsii TaxID=1857215 RepID=A0ABQ6YXD5_9ENTE|nr:Cof-type HAD-IIB family hydrolase [Enterococcus sp. CU12B]KAF1302403.1 HAD family hydrolase [Enterococcus sp. CU12B]